MPIETVAMGYIFFDDKVLLVKHAKTDTFMACGGHVQEGELLTEGLVREMKEETNLDAEIIYKKQFENVPHELPLPFICSYKRPPGKDSVIQIFEYLCRAKDIANLRMREDELLEARWFSREDIVESTELRPSLKEIALKAFDSIEGQT